MLECGSTFGSGCSSCNPMHWPVFAPVQGMPWTSGRLFESPGRELEISPGFVSAGGGAHWPLAGLTTSPGAQAATAGAGPVDGIVKAATAGAAATASAKPPAMARRRAEFFKVAILVLSTRLLSGCVSAV